MEVMGGATPNGLEQAGIGETPRLEMVLPGVTAMPGAGDEPEGQRSWLDSTGMVRSPLLSHLIVLSGQTLHSFSNSTFKLLYSLSKQLLLCHYGVATCFCSL